MGGHVDANIIFDETPKAVLKADEENIVIPIEKTERAIQAEIIDENGKSFRSNAYFFVLGKSTDLYLYINGYQMSLTIKDPVRR
mgnify:CR=1 FL=1